jgi:hypothetical protein
MGWLASCGWPSNRTADVTFLTNHGAMALQDEILETDHFELNRSEVAVKIIDGEAVAIDVLTGKYHGMSGTACGILHLIGLGIDLAQIADALESRYPGEKGHIREDILRFAGQLLEQRLVLRGRGPVATLDAQPAFDGATYEVPVLETYDDMAELLALDPPMPTVLDTPWDGDAWSSRDPGLSRDSR